MALKNVALPALLAGAIAAPAFAGNLEPVAADPYVLPVSSQSAGRDWTGLSLGGQIGYGAFDTDGAANTSKDKGLYGIKAGYDRDFGNWVGGVGIQYDWTDADLGSAGTVDGLLRIGGRAGVAPRDTFFYGTAGYAKAYTSGGSLNAKDSDGYYLGVGAETFVTDNWTLGTEVVYNRFEDFNAKKLGLDATTLNVSLNYRF